VAGFLDFGYEEEGKCGSAFYTIRIFMGLGWKTGGKVVEASLL